MKTQIKYSLSNFIKLVEILILNIGLARVVLDIPVFGKLQQFFLVVTFLVTLSTAFPTTLNYFIGNYSSLPKRNSIYKRFFFSMAIFTVVATLLLFLFRHEFTYWFKNEFFTLFIIYFSGILFLKIINSFFSNFYLFSNKLNHLNIISGLFLCVFFSGFVYFGYNETSVEYIVLFFLIYELLKFLVLSIPFLKSFNAFNSKKDVLLKKEELKFVLPTVFLVLAGILNMQIDKFMISTMETPEVFAFYQVGAFNIPFVAVITTSFFTTVTPMLTKYLKEKNIPEVVKLTNLTVKQTSVLLLPIIIFCFFYSTEIIVLLFGRQYQLSGEIFKIYSLRFLISVFPFSIFMGIIGLKNFASIHVVASALINVLCNFLLIPEYGVMGAVVGTLIASYTTVIIPIIYINRKLGVGLNSYFPLNNFFKIIGVSVIILLPMWLFLKYDFFLMGKRIYYIIPFSLIYYVITVGFLERNVLFALLKKVR